MLIQIQEIVESYFNDFWLGVVKNGVTFYFMGLKDLLYLKNEFLNRNDLLHADSDTMILGLLSSSTFKYRGSYVVVLVFFSFCYRFCYAHSRFTGQQMNGKGELFHTFINCLSGLLLLRADH